MGLADFVDIEAINAFTCMDLSTAIDLTRDFYRPVAAEYPFNFALMSKHALSKIYERYVAILDFDEEKSRQTSLFPELPEESIDRKIGAVYTPQYIATFFSKYIQENVPPRLFRKLKSIDPACGSGIFIRTLLEFQCNPFVAEIHRETISRTFSLATAIDRDQNACDATRLSLSLLHLSITGLPPETLNIRAENSISLAMLKKLKANHYDAVISNPPYIPLARIPKEEKQLYEDYLDGHCVGRIDSYLAFVKLSLTIVKPGGFVCLVIPHNFLLAKNAAILRKRMRKNFWIRVIADLSEIEVFEGIGVYVILLILQKKSGDLYNDGHTQVIKAKGFVGRALQFCLERKRIEAPFYAVYDIKQDTLGDERWVLLPPSEINLQRKLRRFVNLTSYFDVKQGFISGIDSVFVRRESEITEAERNVYLAYLPDKQMERYRIRKKLNQVVFYPYEDGKPLKEADLRAKYPRTWKYLAENKKLLTQRGAVTSGDTPWWRPVRPRSPKNMLRAKIVCPHLALTPRFAIDLKGNVAVSHSPFLFIRSNFEAFEVPMLKIYCAILNSSVVSWYLSRHGYKYSRGYIRLEVHTLKTVPVPNLDNIEYELKSRILKMVDRALVHGADPDVESEIDRAVAQLYGLTDDEYNIVAGLT